MVWKESLSDQNAFIQILFHSAYFVLFRKTKINFNISQSVFTKIVHLPYMCMATLLVVEFKYRSYLRSLD